MRRSFALALALCVIASPARADWYQASSQHFLIYSEQKPETLQRFAEKLERFDSAVRLVRAMDDIPASKGNRLTVFVGKSADFVQRLANDKSGMLEGFYVGRVSGSVAYVSLKNEGQAEVATGSHIAVAADNWMRDDTVLLHEYAHHLMFQDAARPYPQWFVEGFAEFMSTAQFDADGSVGLGLPAKHRYAGLLLGEQLPLEKLISGKYDDLTNEQLESIYGRGWLLTHYLTFEPARAGQLAKFVEELEKGIEPLAAARQEFGDLEKLNRDLDSYLHRSKLKFVKIPGASLRVGPIEVSPLTPGAAAALPFLMQLKNSPDSKDADALANSLKPVEARFSGDAFVETVLAEAELDADKFDAAEVAADRALTTDPQSTRAMILKGRAVMERLSKARTPGADFAQARNWFLKANQVDREDPEPLYQFYVSFEKQGVVPTSNAIAALHYASVLAPQDENLRLMSAGQFLFDGKVKEARAALIPIAFDPHGQDLSATARSMISSIDKGDAAGALRTGGWMVETHSARTH